MLIIVGLVIVLGSVVGGYLMAGGSLLVLNQPSEFIVIGGAAIGSLVISTPQVSQLRTQVTLRRLELAKRAGIFEGKDLRSASKCGERTRLVVFGHLLTNSASHVRNEHARTLLRVDAG